MQRSLPPSRRVLLHPSQRVRVGVQRRAAVRVAEDLLYGLEPDAVRQHRRRRRVPQAVEDDARQPGGLADLVELADVV